MSHILGSIKNFRYTEKPTAYVLARAMGDRLVVPPGVLVSKPDVKIAELPSKIFVVDEEGNAIIASGKFFISTETIDPFHALMDMGSTTKERGLE